VVHFTRRMLSPETFCVVRKGWVDREIDHEVKLQLLTHAIRLRHMLIPHLEELCPSTFIEALSNNSRWLYLQQFGTRALVHTSGARCLRMTSPIDTQVGLKRLQGLPIATPCQIVVDGLDDDAIGGRGFGYRLEFGGSVHFFCSWPDDNFN
jgi:hypothetical protein